MPKQWGEALMEGGLALANQNRGLERQALAENQQRMGLEQLRMQQEEHAINKRKAEHEEKIRQEGERIHLVDDVINKAAPGMVAPQKKQVIDWITAEGLAEDVEGKLTIKQRNIPGAIKTVIGAPDRLKQLATARIGYNDQRIAEIEAALPQVKKPEEQATLLKEKAELTADTTVQLNAIKHLDPAIRKMEEQQKFKEEQMKQMQEYKEENLKTIYKHKEALLEDRLKSQKEKPSDFDKKMAIAAATAGVPYKKVKDDTLTAEEAAKVAQAYKRHFGSTDLLGALGGAEQPVTVQKRDKNGNLIK